MTFLSGNSSQWVQRATEIIQHENRRVGEYQAPTVAPPVLNSQTCAVGDLTLSTDSFPCSYISENSLYGSSFFPFSSN